ncbi:hypothetical protein GCM10027422_31660 [Hymenobacter arcticus]
MEKRTATETISGTSFTAGSYLSGATGATTNDIYTLSSTYAAQIDGRALIWRQNNSTLNFANTTANNGSNNLNTPMRATVTLTFTREVSNLKFRVQDIDKGTLASPGGLGGGSDYTDEFGLYALRADGTTRVPLTAADVALGTNNTNAFVAGQTIDGLTHDVVRGTALNGTTTAPNLAGDVTITFSQPVKSVRLTFRNLNTYQGTTTRLQTLGIEEISWCAQADVATTLAGPTAAIIGSTVTYVATVTNNGDDQVTSVRPTVQLAQNLTNVTGGTYVASSGLLTLATIPNLAADASVTRNITFTMPSTNVTGVVSVPTAGNGSTTAGSSAPDPTLANNNGSLANASVTTIASLPYSISGTVFEDVNYGGGLGRSITTANAVTANSAVGVGTAGTPATAATVELYNATTGAFVASTTTSTTAGSLGQYTFANLPGSTSYITRVVNTTVRSTRTGSTAALLGVQTFNGTTDRVGGEAPNLTDAAANTTSANLSTLTPTNGTTAAQSLATVNLGTANAANIDFGFNFDAVVNTNDTGQGSLRQFVLNANALGGEAALAQRGSRVNAAGTTVTLPTGQETSIFMIPSGSAVAGQRSGLASGLTNGVAVINTTTALTLTGANAANTVIDGTTQTFNIGNTNAGTATNATATTVGVDNVALGGIQQPEVEISGSAATVIDLEAANLTLRGLAAHGGSNQTVLVGNTTASSGYVLENALIGATSDGARPATNTSAGYGIYVNSNAGVGTVQNSLVAYNGFSGMNVRNGTGTAGTSQFVSNFFVKNGFTQGGGDGITFGDGALSGPANVANNFFTNQNSSALQFEIGTTSATTITNNTITNSGTVGDAGAVVSSVEGGGIVYLQRDGTKRGSQADVISKNVITNSQSAGIVVGYGQQNITISQNNTNGNGGLGIDLINNANYYVASGNATGAADYGDGDGVTLNDGSNTAAATTAIPNKGIDYPIIVSATIVGNTLVVKGYAKPGVTAEFFLRDADTGNFGEGQTYLGGGVENGTGDLNTATTTLNYSGTINGLNQGTDNSNTARAYTFNLDISTLTAAQLSALTANGVTATATLSTAGTSEFSAKAPVNTAPVPNTLTNVSIPNTNGATVLNPNLSGTANGTLSNGTANSIAYYTVASLPASGTLTYNGIALTTANIATTQIANPALLTYTPVAGYTGGSVSFTYTTTDANGITSTTNNNGGTVTNGPATYTIPVSQVADVTTALTGPATVVPGQSTGTYTASFTNEGPNVASAVMRTVTLPAGATNILVNGVAYTPAATAPNVIDFGTATTLASGASNAFTFSFTPATTATGSLAVTSNVTTMTSQGINTSPDFSTITATVAPVADVATTLVANTTPVAAGTLATATNPAKFTVTFTNNGPVTADGVTGRVQLPSGLTGVVVSFPNGANGVSGSYNTTTGVVTYSGATSIPSGGTITSGIAFDAPVNGPVVATSFISTTSNEAGKQANNTASATININPAFDLATTISGPASAVAGDLITLAVMTTNNGPSAAPNAVQTVSLPQGLANVYVSNGGAYNGTAAAKDITVNGVTYTNVQPGQVVFPTLGSLPNGQTVANSVSFSQPASAYSPIAKLTTAGTGETNTANNTAYLNGAASATNVTVATPVAGTANAYTTITSSVPSTTIGSPITLTVVTGNNGPNQATGVIQTVLLLPGLTGVTSSNGGIYNSTTGIVTFPALTDGANGSASGTSVSNTITFNAPASTGNNGQLLATATVSTTNTDPIAADNVASVGVTLLQSTDLATTITGPASALVGQPVTYTATFVNNGPMTATNVTGIAQLPAGLTASTVVITDATGTVVTGASYSTTTGLVTFPTQATVLNGASQVYNITFVAPAQTLVVRSSVSSSSADAVLTNNNASTTTTMTASADLATTVAGPATAVVGSPVTYSVTTTNNGPSTATNTVTTLQLAQNLTTVSVPNGSYNPTSGLVTFNTLASQAPGTTTTNYVTFVMPSATGGQTTGVASATSGVTDPTPGNNTASVATSVAPTTTTSADITASVTAGSGTATPGSTIAFTATYGNLGTDPAVNVVPTLQLNPGLTVATITVANQTGTLNNGLITFSTTGAVYNPQTGLVTFPTIASQAAGVGNNVSYLVNVTAPANGPVVAVAATTSNTSEPNTTAARANDVQSAPVTITPSFDEVTSLSGPASAPVGSNLTYVVTTTNNGPSVTTNTTTQTVTLPTGVVPTSGSITNGGVYSSGANTITWTIPAGQAAGANGAVANSFTIVQPAGGATVTANVTVTGESNTGNNSANLNGAATSTATTVTNQAPLAYAVVNSLQSPMSNEVAGSATGVLISPLNGSDPENAFATTPYTVTAIPSDAQGILYFSNDGTTTGTYSPVTVGKQLTVAQANTLKFKPVNNAAINVSNTTAANGFVGNASFTYTVTDAASNVSPAVSYTLPVEVDAPAASYTKTPLKGGGSGNGIYANGNIIAYTTDANGAVYDATSAAVYQTDGSLQSGTVSNGIKSASAGTFTGDPARPEITTLAGLGLAVDATGRLFVQTAANLKSGSYSVVINTLDLNGGLTSQTVSFVIGASPLPVVLTALTAQAVQNRDALLSWTTASEVNSAYFDVERSLDGTNFTKIGQVAAKGNSTISNNYSFTDASVAARASGAVYYRLRQVDLDATASYSPIRTVSFTKVATVALSLYPNPAQNATTLDVSALPATGTYQVLVLDATGRAVRTVSVGGGQLQTLSLTDLASGTYQVLVTGTLANGDALRQVIRLTKE